MTYEITPTIKSDKGDITTPCCNAIYKYRKANIWQESKIAIQILDWICFREKQNFRNSCEVKLPRKFHATG